MNKKEYINKVLEYVKENNITVYDYYLEFAKHMRNHDDFTLQPFELQNPFVKGEDINKLLTSTDDKIVEYFAYVMSDTINSSTKKSNREDIIEVLDEELEPKIKLMSINRKLTDTMNGFAVVKEEKTGRIHLYYHDAETDTLKGEEVYLNNSIQVDSGYYINFEEYVDNLINEIFDKYPNANNISFVRDDGKHRTLSELLEEAYNILRQRGAMRYGEDLFKEQINSFKDLKNINTSYTQDFAGEPLRVGVYVRRDLVTRIFAKFKIKFENIEEKEVIKK